MKIYIKDIRKYIGKEIEMQGFIYNLRDLQYVQFLVLNDSTGKVQVTLEKNDENFSLSNFVSSLTVESTIKVRGMVVENPNVKMGGIEIIPTDIELTSEALTDFPIDMKDKNKSLRETRLDYRFLDLRKEEHHFLFKLQTFIESKMREYWYDHDFIEIHTPKISGASAEGGSSVFKLDYFGMKACLSQSPQLYKQMAMASGFNKVFEIAQVFRAEESHTSYHATEILMVDMEISWIDSVTEVMDFEEAWLKYVFTNLKEKYSEEVKKYFNVDISDVTVDFPRISFDECKSILKEKYNYMGASPLDFERKEEELIGKYAKEQYGSDFVFITAYPWEARPFYTMKSHDGIHTESFDLLYKGLEITSGAMREHRHEILKNNIMEKGLKLDDFDNFISFFKYGCPPHGGLGFGMARLLMQLLNIDNVREVTFVYRGPNRLNP